MINLQNINESIECLEEERELIICNIKRIADELYVRSWSESTIERALNKLNFAQNKLTKIQCKLKALKELTNHNGEKK